ncbi:hypothetical protein [Paenibacillus sinopodophylli]|uniref:hypothetical protein n=1 Tax=Paenibacillus sinopodophylli TaxID=1837342 RepID=UPI00110CD81B|nr:hypothetical protein [Paenibacillus sinopodophylli]
MQSLFNELIAELEILRGREDDLVKQAEIAQKHCYNSRVDRNTYLPLDVALYNYDEAMAKLEAVRAYIDEKMELFRKIEILLENANELPARVAYMRDIERLPLTEIAKRTNYAYGYIRLVSAKAPRLKLA